MRQLLITMRQLEMSIFERRISRVEEKREWGCGSMIIATLSEFGLCTLLLLRYLYIEASMNGFHFYNQVRRNAKVPTLASNLT